MAQQGSAVRFKVELSHVDRAVFTSLDLKMARHASESDRYLLTRLIAYCALYEEGLAFSKGGLSSPDEPALSIHTLDGRLTCWVEIGTPAPERLHKASKASPRLVVFTQHDPALLVDAVRGETVHKKDTIEVFSVPGAFLDALSALFGERGGELSLTITEGQLYATVGDQTVEGTLSRVSLE